MKEPNLCEILKGHESETFYSPVFGNVNLFIEENEIKMEGRYNYMYLTSKGLNRNHEDCCDTLECLVFPSKDQRDWNKWLEEQKPKVPKTWSEFVKQDSRAITYNLEATYNEYQPHCTSYTPIEKSALALLKIHQLIEVGYGGNITKKYIEHLPQDKCFYMIGYNHDSEMLAIRSSICIQYNTILFHTKEQAEEFLKYPENVQLLKDYFMI